MARGNPPNQRVVIGSSKVSAMKDVSSPFFLHSGDHPGLILVSHNLTGNNYNTWSRAMAMALTVKNKIGFVDGTIPRAAQTDLLLNAWNRCNNMVTSWIIIFVSKEIAYSLMYITTTAEIWIDLRNRFWHSNAPQVFQLKKHLTALQQGSLNINTYHTIFKVLLEELKNFQALPACHCGGLQVWLEYQQQENVIQFLMGLNDSYAQTRGQILMMEPLLPLSKVFALVIQEE
ncbi:hypothetical protein PVL29_018297 [Vitis rotundifolia]|uniref:Retrotransposon Copia-like N-terminal domain-containing protein n=1 Tax=Vitis rotundifolia TaxID=103349 RepID=A0AA38Z5A9_VITRO|nr:hypothetical protein PVL29_018297 [Vitis rotundifolia]